MTFFGKAICQTSESDYYYSKRYSNDESTYNVNYKAHEFVSDLKLNGIDSLLLFSFSHSNTVKQSEKIYVIWNYNGIGYIKAFQLTSKKEILESRPKECDLNLLIEKFEELHLDTVISYPETNYKISHDPTLSIELFFSKVIFKDSIEEYLIRAGKEHPKAIWWRMVMEVIKANCP